MKVEEVILKAMAGSLKCWGKIARFKANWIIRNGQRYNPNFPALFSRNRLPSRM